MRPSLLVICHEATRTGSIRVALDLLRSARPTLAMDLAVEVLADGPLSAELREVGTVATMGLRPSVVMANSALAARSLTRWSERVPTVVYVHEKGDALRQLPEADVAALRSARTVLCVSETSQLDLLELGVPQERLSVLPPIVVERQCPPPGVVASAREEAGATGPLRLVLGCGEAGWRKGADLFVDLARMLRSDDVALAWVGRRPRRFARVLDHDTSRLTLGSRLRWIGEVPDTLPYLSAADVLVSTSREDPQPLVPLEAAMVGTPTVGFAIDGLLDLQRDAAAVVVPYPDVSELARSVRDLLDDADGRSRTVAGARRRLHQRQRPEVVVPQFVELIRSLTADGGSS